MHISWVLKISLKIIKLFNRVIQTLLSVATHPVRERSVWNMLQLNLKAPLPTFPTLKAHAKFFFFSILTDPITKKSLNIEPYALAFNHQSKLRGIIKGLGPCE